MSPEVGEGGGRSTGIVSKGEIHWILEEWYTFCDVALREMKWDFPYPFKINPSSLFKLLRWSSNSVTSMMSQST